MLSDKHIIVYARGLVAEINGDIQSPALRDSTGMRALKLHEEKVRAWAEETLRGIATLQRADAPDWKRGVQWRVAAHEVAAVRKRLRKELWDECAELTAEADEMAARDIDLPATEFRLDYLDYDSRGHLRFAEAPLMSREVRVALTIAELLSADSPAQVLVCPLESCNKLFVRELRQAGRPQLFCCRAHATTFRSHKHRPPKTRINARRRISESTKQRRLRP